MSRISTDPPVTPASVVETDLERELRQLRERLAYYEGFDALIAENVRQSGELMRQAISSQERASEARALDRSDIFERVRGLAADLDDVRSRLDAIAGAVGQLEAAITGSETTAPTPPLSVKTTGSRAVPALATLAQPSTIDVVVHGLTKATPALALQRHLAALDGVNGVETREFSEGILRLRLTASRALTDADLAGWNADAIDSATFEAGLVNVTLK